MPEYQFTGDYPLVFPLEYSDTVTVTRAEDTPDDVPTEGSVVLYPGDTLVTAEPVGFYHAFLPGSPLPADAAPAGEPAGEPGGEQAPPPADTPKRRRSTPADTGDTGGGSTDSTAAADGGDSTPPPGETA